MNAVLIRNPKISLDLRGIYFEMPTNNRPKIFKPKPYGTPMINEMLTNEKLV